MEYSIWHRPRDRGPWVLIAMRSNKPDAVREFERLLQGYRTGALRIAAPDGLVFRVEGCPRERVPA